MACSYLTYFSKFLRQKTERESQTKVSDNKKSCRIERSRMMHFVCFDHVLRHFGPHKVGQIRYYLSNNLNFIHEMNDIFNTW